MLRQECHHAGLHLAELACGVLYPARRRGKRGASFASLNGTAGNLVAVIGYANAAVTAGIAYGSEASGIRAATAANIDLAA